ncbi:MAG: heavy-metal-associated domain-containing protein [Candidatus Micrarchaeia archaeon]|jgi:copper chaperone CopZ
MKTEKIAISGMTCETCEKLITRAVEKAGASVKEISASKGFAIIDYDGDKSIIESAIEKAGYSLDELPPSTPLEKQLSTFMSDFIAGKPATKALRECFTYSVASFFILCAALYFVFGTPNKYALYMVYSALSAVAVGGAVALARAYKSHFNCMEGMMVGMTVGMSAGFLFGAIVGATNGMFVGSVFGMLIGMALGYYVGKACGIMGAMEGLMAGIMGGTMGAMLTVMMQFDHLGEFMPLFVASNLLVLAGLKYMIYYYAGKRGEVKFMQPLNFFALALVLLALTVAVILFAPHFASGLAY